MGKKFIRILLTIILCLNMACSAVAQGFPDKPDVTDFGYTLKDKTGAVDTAITSGGSLEVNITLENNTSSIQPYVISLQVLNNEKKVSIKYARGLLNPSDEENICLSDGFPETETDFSKYSAEVYVWSDMDSMQPISTYSVLGSDNNDIYAFKIDNADLVYAHNNTALSYSFAEGYSGRRPTITPIFRDLASKYIPSDAAQTVTSDGQQTLSFLVSSQTGAQKDYRLTMYGEDNPKNTKNAYLKSIAFPMGTIDNKYNGIGFLYPEFNKSVTEYTVFTYMKNYADFAQFKTIASDATITSTTAPDTTLENTSAVYTVTSADGTASKDYTINYITNKGTTLNITGIKNGVVSKSGKTDFYGWYRGSRDPENVWEYTNMVIQDGVFGNRSVMATRPIIEIDISQGPDVIKHGILTLSNIKEIYTSLCTSGTLRLYKIDDSIYSDGGIASITETQTQEYFSDEICSVDIGLKSSTHGDMYYINIGADYYNSLKSAGRTKMYIGFAGEVGNGTKALGAVFGNGGTAYDNSRFHCITE